MARVAFFTFGVLRRPTSHPQSQGFVDRIAGAFAEASAAAGFIGYPQEKEARPDNPRLVWPAAKGPDREAMMTLSLWQDLESVFAFSYARQGVHSDALRLRKEWFLKPAWPNYVAWWVGDDHLPTWQEAVDRHLQLSRHGPTADAFDFHAPYGAEGRPTRVLRRPIALDLAPRASRP
jgi:hypothetical protein